MSAGEFEFTKYERDDGAIHNVRVQPETLALTIASTANTAPTGAVTAAGSAQVGAGRRGYGIHTRFITVRFTGTFPDGYKGTPISRIPILQKSVYDGFQAGATGTYLGQPISVVSKSPEIIR